MIVLSYVMKRKKYTYVQLIIVINVFMIIVCTKKQILCMLKKIYISILNHTGYDVLCKNCNEMTTYYECKECHNVTCYCGCINGINNCRCKPIGQRELNLYPYYFKGMYILDSPSVDYGCRYCDKDVKKEEKYTINIDNDKFKIINTGNFEEYKIDSKKLKNHYLANIRCKYCDKTHMDYESWL